MALDIKRHAKSEESARKFLERFCWPAGKSFCPRCGTAKPYTLAGGRLRCSGCRYTFHALTGRFIGLAGLSPRQWLRLLRLFADDETVRSIASSLGLAYNTAYKAATVVRLAILATSRDGLGILQSPLGHELGFNGRALHPRPAAEPQAAVPVFGILERDDVVGIDYLPDMVPEDLLHDSRMPLSRLGAIIYSDCSLGYETLVACGAECLVRRFEEMAGRVPAVHPRQSGFWSYARGRLVRFHGITARKFPLYLKELEFRYNHLGQDILPILLENICSLVPDLN